MRLSVNIADAREPELLEARADYEGIITKVEPETSQRTGHQMLVIDVQIEDKSLRYWSMIEGPQAYRTRLLYDSLGLSESYDPSGMDTDPLLQLGVKCKVIQEERERDGERSLQNTLAKLSPLD